MQHITTIFEMRHDHKSRINLDTHFRINLEYKITFDIIASHRELMNFPFDQQFINMEIFFTRSFVAS